MPSGDFCLSAENRFEKKGEMPIDMRGGVWSKIRIGSKHSLGLLKGRKIILLEECIMKKMKRLVAVLLAGVMVLAMLTACGGAGTSEIGKKLEDEYLKAMNSIRTEKDLTNNTGMRNKALALLNYIDEDGMIDKEKAEPEPDVEISKDGKTMTVTTLQVAVEGEPVNGKYVAKEITPEVIGNVANIPTDPDPDFIATMNAVKKIGIATKVINGKTYAAIAIELVIPVPAQN